MKIKFVMISVLTSCTLALAANYSSWIYSRDITVNPTTAGGITAAETNYPLLIRLTTAGGSGAGSFNFAQAAGNGSDIRFTAADSTTDLPYEIESWDSANGSAQLWVQVNALGSSANAVLRMYWGKPGSPATSSGGAVFNSALNSFKAVLHFNNSLANSSNLTVTPVDNGTTDINTTSIIGHARSFGTASTTTAYINLGSSTAADSLQSTEQPHTLSVWAYSSGTATANNNWHTMFEKGYSSSEEALRITVTSGTNARWDFGNYNGTNYYAGSTSATFANLTGAWHYITGTSTGTVNGGVQTLYVDGVQVGTATNGSSTSNPVENWYLGRFGSTAGRNWRGHMDEARIAGTTRDASWIKWDFETQKANQTAVTYGTVASFSVPGAPTGVTASAGNGQATVTWVAPSSNGGTAITGYTATSSPEGKTCTTTGNLSCAVIGLTNGSAYTFIVTAANPVGNSAASSASSAVTPVAPPGVPGPPTGATAVAGNAQATVGWTAPASDGGSPITGYTATSNPDGKTCTTTGATTCVVTGLTNGTGYTFTVVAMNSAGSSSASAATVSVPPLTVPAAPASISAAAGNAQVVVTWAAPSSNGGATITAYKAMAVADTTKSCTTNGSTLTCTITGLTNGTAYTFTAKATNAAGVGAASAASAAVTPATLPGAPTNVTGVGANGQITVSWTAPASNGGSVITGYTVTAVQDTIKHCSTTGATSCVVTGLINIVPYSFTVTATNALGTSTASNVSPAVTGILSLSKDLDFHVTGSTLFLRLPEDFTNSHVSMVDLWGRIAWTQKVAAGTHQISLEKGSALPPGVYILRVTTQDSAHKSRLAMETKILLTP